MPPKGVAKVAHAPSIASRLAIDTRKMPTAEGETVSSRDFPDKAPARIHRRPSPRFLRPVFTAADASPAVSSVLRPCIAPKAN